MFWIWRNDGKLHQCLRSSLRTTSASFRTNRQRVHMSITAPVRMYTAAPLCTHTIILCCTQLYIVIGGSGRNWYSCIALLERDIFKSQRCASPCCPYSPAKLLAVNHCIDKAQSGPFFHRKGLRVSQNLRSATVNEYKRAIANGDR